MIPPPDIVIVVGMGVAAAMSIVEDQLNQYLEESSDDDAGDE